MKLYKQYASFKKICFLNFVVALSDARCQKNVYILKEWYDINCNNSFYNNEKCRFSLTYQYIINVVINEGMRQEQPIIGCIVIYNEFVIIYIVELNKFFL